MLKQLKQDFLYCLPVDGKSFSLCKEEMPAYLNLSLLHSDVSPWALPVGMMTVTSQDMFISSEKLKQCSNSANERC